MSETLTQAPSPRLDTLPLDEEIPEGITYGELALAPGALSAAPFRLSRVAVAPGVETPVDVHQVHELWLVGQGEGELTYDGVASRIRAGDVVRFVPEKTHTVRNDGAGDLVSFSLWWK
ncbi:MAG TPA: cupin domain-containing protein [Longimicrobium sp.]|nr:cupin domain-containing protein [Longimicrobium sp.]